MLNRKLFDEMSDDGADGGGTDWRTALPEDLRDNPAFKDVKDIGSMAKQYADLQSHLGNSIRIPSEDAGEEDRAKFYEKVLRHAPNLMPRPDRDDPEAMQALFTALGRPGEADGYGDVEVPEEIQLSDDRLNSFREMAFKHGLTNEQFQGLMADVLQGDAESTKAEWAQHQESLQNLKNEWGAAFDQRKAQIVKLMEMTGAPEAIVDMAKNDQLEVSSLKWVYDISKRFGGEGVNVGSDDTRNTAMTPDEAEERISEIMNNQEHPYWIASHPDHAKAVKKMLKLMSFADPKASTDPRSLGGAFISDT